MFDLKILIDRKIIQENQDIDVFLNNFSSEIFSDSVMSNSFFNLLKNKYVALSTSTYNNSSDSKSAIALKLDKNNTTLQNCNYLEKHIKNGVGVGINFSNFENPTDEIKKINNFFKSEQPNLNRPPAGIALLNVTHPKIMEFISLKDDVSYDDWCFNNSVVMDKNFLSKVDNDENLILDNNEKISAKKVYDKLLKSMLKEGEPGVIFSDNKNFLCDCCAAAELKENEGLNLAQINLSKFYNFENKVFDYDFLTQSANILSVALKKIAPNGFVSILGYQDLLNQMNLKYGSNEALDVLEKSLKIIKSQANANNIRTCISPSGATSRILKTTPSIEPIGNNKVDYLEELNTMKIAQNFLDGGISKTILLKKHHTIKDVDLIVRYANDNNLKGITVFPIQ